MRTTYARAGFRCTWASCRGSSMKDPEPVPPSDRSSADPPPNPAGGRTLIVDAGDPAAYARPSAALKDAGPDDQVFIKPGTYEDKIFMSERPLRLIGAGRDLVRIFSRRGGPLYLQRVPDRKSVV